MSARARPNQPTYRDRTCTGPGELLVSFLPMVHGVGVKVGGVEMVVWLARPVIRMIRFDRGGILG